MPRRILGVIVLVICTQVARATVITNTRPEIAQMAGLWEVNTIQISPLANAQYPAYGTSNWQYCFPNAGTSTDGDLHHNMAVDASGTGKNGNNIGNSPVVAEVVNATSTQVSYINSLCTAKNHLVVPRGIFRFYTEHGSEVHFELHPITEHLTYNGSAFVVDSTYRQNIKNVAYATGYALSTYQQLVQGVNQTVTATVLADDNRVVFTYPTGAGCDTMNYPQYDGVVVQTLTNDFCSQYFTFLPTNSPAGAISGARVMRCRIVTNTLAASVASGLVSNMPVTVNALNRVDFIGVSNVIAFLSANQSTSFVRPIEFITLGLTALGPIPPPSANFSGSPTNASAPVTVTFTDTSTGSITNRSWNFGDGGTTNTTAMSVQYTYNSPGTNTVTLIVRGLGGSSTNTKPNYVAVSSAGSAPPVADFIANPTSGTETIAVNFTDMSTGMITNRSWDFGDGSTTNVTTSAIVHTYSVGSYDVMLVVAGPGGVSTNEEPNYINVLTLFQSWQIQYFGSTNNPAAAPDADPLGKGMSNSNQFLAGLNPTNPASIFQMIGVAPTNNDVLITWKTAGGRTNVVQAAPDPGGVYSNISANIIITGSGDTITNYLDVGTVNARTRYYRVRLVP
jgi:PKD repeat protein